MKLAKLRAEQTAQPQAFPDGQMQAGGMQQGLLMIDLIALKLMEADRASILAENISDPSSNRVATKDVHNYYRLAEEWIAGRNSYFDQKE